MSMTDNNTHARHHVMLWTQAPGAGPWFGWYDGETAEEAARAAEADAITSADGWPVHAEPCCGCSGCASAARNPNDGER